MHLSKNISSMIILILLVAFSVPVFSIERSEIDDKYKWKPEHIYSDIEAWNADIEKIQEGLDKLASFKGAFAGENATDPVASLIKFNALAKDIEIIFGHAYGYVMYNYHVDMSNPEWNGYLQQLQFLGIEYGQKLAWVEPELLMIPEETMIQYVNDNPELEDYRKGYVDMYLQQAHVLTEAEETIIALSGNISGTASDAFGKLTNVDLVFDPIIDENGEEIEVTNQGWSTWRTNKNRDLREAYFKSLWGSYNQYGNTLAALMAGNLKKNLYYSKVRKYDNTLEAALNGNFIPEEVYINLVETTKANTASLHKYNEIRKRMLGVDHYRHWDYYVDLSTSDESRYTWEESVELIAEALEPLGKDYIKDLRIALDPANGWCDVYASEGKRGGAYSSSCYGVHAYMLYNFDYEAGLSMEDISTVAHELGHTMHTLLSERNQPFPNRSYAIFNAEVASTTNENIFQMKLLEKARKEYKNAKKSKKEAARQKLISLLVQNLGSARGTFFRQTMFAAWEWEANKMAEAGMPLTKESFDNLYGDLLKNFHGPAAEYEELSNCSWSRIPHFYRGYYVYSYATSHAAAIALAKAIRAEHFGSKKEKRANKGVTEKYMNYLKSGSSKHPVELLKDAGIDMTSPDPILACIEYFSELVDELDELTKE